MKEKIYRILPVFFQNALISIFNILAYRQRYGGDYKKYLKRFIENRNLSRSELELLQKKRFNEFLASVKKGSVFYKNYPILSLEDINRFPILSKEELRANLNIIHSIEKKNAIVSKTGGTTGKSLEVLYTKNNMQERFAMLDEFRNRYGYSLGKKTAWFSGKSLLTKKDVRGNLFWKTDYWYNVRYYSTFHVKSENLKYYLENLINYKPEFFVGFPSTILEIAKYGQKHGYKYPLNSLKAIFPTAETITPEMRETIEGFFNAKIYNQYASSEGAPFIFECSEGCLHLELQSGIFEVLDDSGHISHAGRLVLTSFTTEGTPLIRYDIGDRIVLDDESKLCACGNNNPLVKEILGRIDDYIYSPLNGKINLGNVSNTLKDTIGIVKFQVVQNELNALEIFLVIDDREFNRSVEKKFLNNWIDRVGTEMDLKLIYVKDIAVEKSGKFRMVKNNIKHLIG